MATLSNRSLQSQPVAIKSLSQMPSKRAGVVNSTSLPTAEALTNKSLGREIWHSILAPHNLLTVKPTSVIIGVSEKSLPPLNNVVVGKGKTMKSSKTAPQWAIDLVTQVCSDYKRVMPKRLQWYNKQRIHSSGYTWYDGSKIHISAGTDVAEQKIVLLHELTHHLVSKTRKGQRAGHSMKFWNLLFELASKYATVQEAYYREIELATEWRPGTRRKAVMAYDKLPN